MQLVAGKSPAATRGAIAALRAIRVDSPIVPLRVARVAETALADPEAQWEPDERAALVEALAGATSAAPGDALRDDPARLRLSALLDQFGVSQGQLARAAGVDRGTVSDWLSGVKTIPAVRAEWITAITQIDVTPDQLVITLAR